MATRGSPYSWQTLTNKTNNLSLEIIVPALHRDRHRIVDDLSASRLFDPTYITEFEITLIDLVESLHYERREPRDLQESWAGHIFSEEELERALKILRPLPTIPLLMDIVDWGYAGHEEIPSRFDSTTQAVAFYVALSHLAEDYFHADPALRAVQQLTDTMLVYFRNFDSYGGRFKKEIPSTYHWYWNNVMKELDRLYGALREDNIEIPEFYHVPKEKRDANNTDR
jgi:hypothetical protein